MNRMLASNRLSLRLPTAIKVLSLVGLAAVAGGAGTTCVPDPNPGNCNTTTPPTVLAQDHIEGVASAPVTVIEYSDFQ